MPPAILYGFVARQNVVLAECSAPGVQGNVATVAVTLLDKLQSPDHETSTSGGERTSYSLESHVFHLLSADGLTFLCVADQSLGRTRPFAFLEDVKTRFLAVHATSAMSAPAYSLNAAFAPVLRERMLYHSDPKSDTLSRVRGEVGELRDVMVDNIERVLERGERLELLVQRTDDFAERTVVFKRGAATLRRQAWWRNMRTNACVAGMVVVGLYALAAMICSPTLHC
jgi:vesicle-associated membrane protein 7